MKTKIIKRFLKKDYILILLITLPFFIFNLSIINSFEQIPSPLYGGDYYFHYGITQHIYNGNPPWDDPQIVGEYNFYGWFYHSLVAYTAKILHFDIMKTFLFFPLIILILSAFTSYYLGKRLFKKQYWALLFTFIWVGVLTSYHEIHGRPFGTVFLMPLFLLMFLRLKGDKSIRNKIYFGLSFGALGLTHLMAFASAGLFLIVYYIYELILSIKSESLIKRTRELFNTYWLSAIITILTSIAYIGPLLFHYKFKVLNNQPIYSSPIPTIWNLIYFLRDFFFNYTKISLFILSIISIFGLYSVIINREKFEFRVILILLISTLIGGFYYFITMPLGIELMIYWQIITYTQQLLKLLLITIGIITIYNSIKDRNIKYVFIGFVLIILLSTSINQKINVYNGKWTNVGRIENPMMFNMADWVKENTDKNAIFLSTNELSGAINYLTGRKLVVNRGTHTSQFVSMDQRMVDVGIILYGNDTSERKKLLKKYNISYVYYDSSWMNSLTWDPFFVSPKNSEVLDKYNVSYAKVHTKLDPGKNNVPTYDMLQIKYDKLWSKDFEKLIYPIIIWGEQSNPQYAIIAINKTKLEE